MAGPVRRFLTNIVCGCIRNKDTRKHVRVVLNSDILSAMRFVKKNTGLPLKKVKTFIGYQARNLLISINDTYIFKFPLRRSNSDELALRESRIVSALAPFSTIYVPPVETFMHRGRVIRRYEFIHGAQLRKMPLDVALANIDRLAPQVAKFIFDIGCADPKSIRDLKPTPRARPAYMYGWSQGDICDNFIIDTNTMQVVAFIDWEDCSFCDFSRLFTIDKRSPNKEFMIAVKAEYDRLYNAAYPTVGGK